VYFKRKERKMGTASSEVPGIFRYFFSLWLQITLIFLALPAASLGATALSEDCIYCHGTFAEIHANADHAASLGNGPVVLFSDTDHDDAGWIGPRPYFSVTVECATCHASDLLAIHGQNCATCHPTPYGTLGTWDRGCQQGGCHATYHEDETVAHLPYEDRYNYANCSLCHDENNQWVVTQDNCLNCHATYGNADGSPPVTTANALSSYTGPAKIVFSILDNGKVGIGTTFYRIDGGEETAGAHAFVSAPGSHQVQFWSMDQAGNKESPPKSVSFNIVEDTTPPTTVSDAKPYYTQGGTIILTATDDGSLGAKQTYYSLNNGPTRTGTKVSLPVANGIIAYSLSFWSEDWSGNVESKKSVSFTVTSGSGTIRLVWGESDLSGSPCLHDPTANANWSIRSGGWWGPVVASGSAGCPNWSGVNDYNFPVGTTQYFVITEWWDRVGEYYDETWFGNISIATPGQIVRLSY
jgi:hypothetical protein